MLGRPSAHRLLFRRSGGAMTATIRRGLILYDDATTRTALLIHFARLGWDAFAVRSVADGLA